MCDVLAEMKIFQARRSALAGLERVLVVIDPQALIGPQVLSIAVITKGVQVGLFGILCVSILLIYRSLHFIGNPRLFCLAIIF